MRLIDADAVREVHCASCSEAIRSGCENDPVCASLLWIDEAPTVDAVPVKHGRWKGEGFGAYSCSLCVEVVSGNEYKYCPNCGARMDGEPE